jgi:hypothetical protein
MHKNNLGNTGHGQAGLTKLSYTYRHGDISHLLQ